MDTRCVEEHDLSLVTRINGLDAVAGGLRFLGCNRNLLSDQVIHQRGFSHVRTADQGYKAGFIICIVFHCCLFSSFISSLRS